MSRLSFKRCLNTSPGQFPIFHEIFTTHGGAGKPNHNHFWPFIINPVWCYSLVNNVIARYPV